VNRRQRIEDLNDIALPEQPALSPDGEEVVYVLRTSDVGEDRNVTALWRVGSRDGDPERLTAGPADSAPAWSPDGSSIAFLRAGEGPAQVWLLPARGGEARRLTDLPLGAGRPSWSPDGSRIAFAAPVDLLATPGESDEDQARRGHDPLVAERLDYQADGLGIRRGIHMHLHVVDVETGHCRRVTDGDLDAGGPVWAPDGKRLAFPALTGGDRDLVFSAPVHVVPADGSADPEVVALADAAALALCWTPDGTGILAVATDPEKGPSAHAHLLLLSLDAGDLTDLAASLDRNVMSGGPGYPGAAPQVAGDGRTVVFCVRDRGCTHLYSVPLDGGEPRPLVSEAGTVVSGASVAGSRVAVVVATPAVYGEVAVVELGGGGTEIRTRHSPDPDEIELFPRDEREFAISDGTTVHGWLVRDSEAPTPQPLLLDVHGGPHNAWNGAADSIHLYHQELAARGWAVLLLNPRGSDGYGEDFYRGVLESWGEADARDFLEPIDALVAEGLADPERLAVTGYSYGGYMTCYLTSRDERFAAAAAGGVVSDLVSMGGTSDDAHLLARYELGGESWAIADRYQAMSPLSRVERVATPTLVYHGDSDRRCPVSQAQQWHTALRERGVPTTLVLYPDEGHLFILDGRPSHRRDFNRRVTDWIEQYAGVRGARRRPRLDDAHWRRRLAALAERHRVPGAVLGILRLGDGTDENCVAAYGSLNKATGVETTDESVFQIGSMTKVWTATVVLQLVDEGKLDLDAPVVEVLPELRLSDRDAAARLTMRHLLTHTSGIDGDVFTDTGRGDDCLERYVALLADAAQIYPLEATWSYCNSGFVLAGRVIEKLTGGTWDAAINERLIGPLAMTHTGTLPEEALLHRAAVGHVSEDGAEPERAPAWALPRALGPAGLVNSTAADVLAFARMHLVGGLAPDGTRILSETAITAMTEHQADLPDKYTLGDSWGLGWIRFGWDGRRLIGHDGNTLGQAAFLRVLPDEGLAVTLLTNGGNTRDLYEDLYREIFLELAGVEMPRPLTPPSEPVQVDVGPHLGAYERAGARLEVLAGAGADGPVLRTTVTGPLAALVSEPTHEYPMVAVGDDLFLVRDPDSVTWTAMTFYDLPTGESYLHFGVRATPKTG
jgi:dipeptidyl aminopeptidase/acylaminoacyl peptidase/CubicO group peptidase (beta-lactamase class C family)